MGECRVVCHSLSLTADYIPNYFTCDSEQIVNNFKLTSIFWPIILIVLLKKVFKTNVKCDIYLTSYKFFLDIELISSTFSNIFNTLLAVNILKWIFVKAHLYIY